MIDMNRTKAQFLVVTYDITDDRRRVKIANILKSFGERVQLSVFECWLTAEELEELRGLLSRQMDPDLDSIRIYAPRKSALVLGSGVITEEAKFYVA